MSTDSSEVFPLITVVTINYNNRNGLLETIESVVSQNLSSIEYLVIDGGSNDGSVDLIKFFNKNINCWISEKDSGIYNAVNKGIKKARGEYLIFLNSGDCFNNAGIIKNCFIAIHESPEVDIFYGDAHMIHKKNSQSVYKKFPSKLDLQFFKNDTLNHQASIIRKEIFYEYNLYPEKYKLACDYWLYLKCFLNNKKYKHLDFIMVNYNLDGISSRNYKKYHFEKELIWQELVPASIQQLLEASKKLQLLLNSKLVRYAILINSKIRAIKK